MINCFKGKFRVTSPYGNRVLNGKTEFHKGVDVVAVDDPTVYSICNGRIYNLLDPTGFGMYCRVDLSSGLCVIFAHLKEYKAQSGSIIKAGDPIGTMGASGNVTGAHTHIEIRKIGTKESLDIHHFTGIPSTLGTYTAYPEFTAYEAACNVESYCELSKPTINYMWQYEYASDLFKKLNLAILFS